ncbi:hypothetical protein B0T25DRAFT_555079 [Lasiosphaeria hispida]|uniref:Uncharacterized protein n=1 Tax=Lasiosphaeria hispida TaxID=260671 RepID=A0AAJ0H8M1_9PEZI|nr:hypothetical protein B0T25DRAFT_555079 [Lasiosphaeria hispida]
MRQKRARHAGIGAPSEQHDLAVAQSTWKREPPKWKMWKKVVLVEGASACALCRYRTRTRVPILCMPIHPRPGLTPPYMTGKLSPIACFTRHSLNARSRPTWRDSRDGIVDGCLEAFTLLLHLPSLPTLARSFFGMYDNFCCNKNPDVRSCLLVSQGGTGSPSHPALVSLSLASLASVVCSVGQTLQSPGSGLYVVEMSRLHLSWWWFRTRDSAIGKVVWVKWEMGRDAW